MSNEPEQATPPSDPPEEQTAEARQYREISKEELEKILQAHSKWLQSKQSEGEKANLSMMNLSGIYLSKVNLSGADLSGADLAEANLSLANLSRCYLFDANLSKANLSNTDISGAWLDGANLTDADLRGIKIAPNTSFKKANLSRASGDMTDLSKGHFFQADLTEGRFPTSNFSGANLYEASLSKALLTGSNFSGALLIRTNLREANLTKTELRNANLQDADLNNAKGLVAVQLAGANVSGAKLPEDIAKFDGLGYVEEISKKAGKLFISMLLGCVYAWLTIGTTTDVGLLTNSSSSPLPVIQAKIPIAGFYWAAPPYPFQPVRVVSFLPPTFLGRVS